MAVRILQAGRLCLDGLRHRDLGAGACGLGIEAHVLAFEGGHEVSLAEQDPAYGRDRHRFPRIGCRPDDHHRAAGTVKTVLHIEEDIAETRVSGTGDAVAPHLVGDVLADGGAMDEQAVGAVPDRAILALQHAAEILVLARIERAVAVGAVLSPEMAGVVLA